MSYTRRETKGRSAANPCKKKRVTRYEVTRSFLHLSEFNPARARLSPRSCSGHDSTWI